MKNGIYIALGLLGYTLLMIFVYVYLNHPQPNIITLNKITSYQIVPEQIHIAFDTINTAYLTFSCKVEPEMCTVSYLDKHLEVVKPTHILHNSFIYKVLLQNLPDDSLVDYKISCIGGLRSSFEEKKIMSHPGLKNNVSLLILGDWSTSLVGDYYNPQHTLIPKPNILPAILKETSPFSSIWHLGDFAYDLFSNKGTRGDDFLNDLEPLISKIAYMSVVGNHEIPEIFQDFTSRFSTPLFYSLPMGKAMIIAISSEFDYYLMKPGAFPYQQSLFLHLKHKQLAWLQDTLSSINREDFPWLIIMGHKPLYCSQNRWSEMITKNCGIQASVMRETFEEIFIKYEVDMYISGHVHLYERILPVKRGEMEDGFNTTQRIFEDSDAPMYLINGVAGNLENEGIVMNITDTPAEWSAFMSESLGYGILNIVNSTHLYYEQYAFGDTQNDEIIEDLYSQKRVEDYFWVIKNK